MTHLSDDEITLLLADLLTPARHRSVIRHLLAGCRICCRKLLERAPERLLGEAGEHPRGKLAEGSPLRKATAAALKQEANRRADESKLQRSLQLVHPPPPGDDGLTFRHGRSLNGVPAIENLLNRSFELRFSNPGLMKWLACNAVKASEGLGSPHQEQRRVFDLQAHSWAHLANSCRLTEDFGEADLALDRSRSLLRRGSGDLDLLAKVAIFEADLRTSQRQFSAAEKLYDKIYKLHQKLENQQLAGRTLISRAINALYAGRPSQAIRYIQMGSSLIKPRHDDKITTIIQQCRIFSLIASGELAEAGTLLLRSGLRERFAGDSLSLLKLRQTEGNLMAGLGRTSAAIRILQEARAEFSDCAKNYNAALIGLDLIPLLLKEGKFGQASATAREIKVTFSQMGVHEEAAKANRYLS
jgi:hypothetical protein